MGLIGYYADLNKKLSDKLTYISKIKAERNTAQDTLKEIYSVLGLEETGDTTELLDYLKVQRNPFPVCWGHYQIFKGKGLRVSSFLLHILFLINI